ncbi:MAG TPA: hypothetical protein VG032_05575 [Acidimicrobiales bacterium]|nr:hypothetical protein [Acidimicrobiales bacterium]
MANFPALFHLVTANPLNIDAYLTPPSGGTLPGLPYIDPNAGYTTQALGHLAAVDWIHGHVPWWNPFEGLGAPLAGEMQSGAFFPLTILLVFHQGLFLLQLILEVLTGFSTYLLIRRLGVGRSFSTAAGVAFGLCGTYAWLAHAPIRPVAFLPLCLLGVELAIGSATQRSRGGWALLSVALALSILAGFPETTFIDGIFVAWWAVLRAAGSDRTYWRLIVQKLATGLIIGVALSAPLLAAIAAYLPEANVGAHNGGFAHVSLPSSGLTQLILPYSLGPIFGFHSALGGVPISQLWGSVGGFLSVTLIAAGLVGLVGGKPRLLRLGLGGWVVVCLLRTFGFPPVVHVLAVIPGVRLTAFYRYSDPSWELAVVVLAAMGLDDIARGTTPRKTLVIGSAITGALALWAGAAAWPVLSNAVDGSAHRADHAAPYVVGSLVFAVGALALLIVGGLRASGRRTRCVSEASVGRQRCDRGDRIRRQGRLLMAGVVAAESVFLFGFTYLSAPAPAPLQTASVSWLQAHLGAYRFVTLGPLQPNYGSFFGIAEANVNDIPLPKSWTSYVRGHLDSNAPPGLFTGTTRVDPAGPTPAQELEANLPRYEAVGVRYVIELSDGQDLQGSPFPAPHSPPWPSGPRMVHHDAFADIWELPAAASLFSLEPASPRSPSGRLPSSCTVDGTGWDDAIVRCSRPAVLVRRVQYLPGWSATADGLTSPVRQDRAGPGGLFQAVTVPAGMTRVRFAYDPSDSWAAVAVAGVALLWLLGSLVISRLRRRRPTPPESVNVDPPS